jgi:hypothetical protein
MKKIILPLVLASTLFANPTESVKKASQVLEKWAVANTVKIEFELTWTQFGKGSTAPSKGTVFIKRPINKENGAFKLITSDLEIYNTGVDYYEFRPRTEQLVIKPSKGGAQNLGIINKYLSCDVSSVKEIEKSFLLNLDVAKCVPSLKKLEITLNSLDLKMSKIVSIMTQDAADNTAEYKLLKTDLSLAMSEADFVPTVTGDIDTLDLR